MGARLFTALLPPEGVVASLDDFLVPRREAEPRLRWTRPDSWHLTTAFLPDVGDRHHDRLVEALDAVAARTGSFTVQFAGGIAFPWPVETKVLALGVSEGLDALGALARRCRNAATCAGVGVDGARFVPHLTLARANRGIDSTRLLRVLDTVRCAAWEAGELVLVASHLHDRGSRYEVLERFSLRPTDEPAEPTGRRDRDATPPPDA